MAVLLLVLIDKGVGDQTTLVGVPEELAKHEIVYNEWMDDFYPGLTPIILGDIAKAYEVKIAPQLFIKRFTDADEQGTRVYGIGFYMAAGVNLGLSKANDGSDVELPLPYVGLVIDGKIEDFESMARQPSEEVSEVDMAAINDGGARPSVIVTQVSNRPAMSDVDKSVDSTLLGSEVQFTDDGPDNSTTSPHL